jgi:hypothetical protein
VIDRLFGRRDLVLYLSLGAIGVGFVAMGLGWLGSARKDTVPEQFPYLLSGGLIGLGLVFAGSALLVVRALEQLRTRFEEPAISARSVEASPNGGRRPSSRSEVIVGASSYHLPSCRLAKRRDGAESVSVEEAKARDLSPCRVCSPPS